MIAGARAPSTLAALSGALGVITGAFGAHGVSDPVAKAWLETGSHYQLVHAVAALVVLGLLRSGMGCVAGWCFVIGGAIFAGTLDVMALGGPRWLGAVTPVGGLLLILGWLVVALGMMRQRAD